MPTLPEILNQLQFVTYEVALLGLFITAGIILIARDWRFLVLALLAQYILVGLILSRLVRPDLAVLKVLIGAFICPILFLSARQVSASSLSISLFTGSVHPSSRSKFASWGRDFLISFFMGADRRQRFDSTGFTFRIFVGFVIILVATSLSNALPLPDLALSITTAVYWLVLAGLVTIALTEDPLKAGLGLLTALTGFGLFYDTLQTSLLLTGLWGAVNLLIALAIGYLTVVKGAGPEERI
jgi:hypothetical protein